MYNYFYKILFSILIGYSFSIIISSFYIKNFYYIGPNSNEIKKNIFFKNNKCYKFIPKLIKCPNRQRHIKKYI